jgi:oligoribonuclease NrnB/cAMP/cGMP phosphodiesterase (DHH superfamily)
VNWIEKEMKTIEGVVKLAKERGLTPKSRILNVTHTDLDGIVSTINLSNYVEEENNLFYVMKNYDNVNQFFTDVVFEGKCSFKNFDWILVTDISVEREVVLECRNRGINLLILDHHATAYHLNDLEECYVDETETLSGAEVTLVFLKEMGLSADHLDKLNRIATQFDLFTFKEDRKFNVGGKKRALAEMLNTIFFKTFDKDIFIKRWKNGWGKGFNKEEIEKIKTEYTDAATHIVNVEKSNLKVDLDENKVLILSNDFVVHVAEHFLDKNKDLVLLFDPKRNKISGRVHDDSPIDIGKIFKMMKEKTEYLTNGGGHTKAGGCNITSGEHLEDFVEKVVKLANYYEKRN